MKQEQKQQPALNLYSILDNEMARMHSLLQAYMTLPQHNDTGYSGISHGSSFGAARRDVPEIYKRIVKMQDLLIQAVAQHDPLIQEKVAELALTGESDPTKP
jgi:hypothetical protein